MSTAEYDRLITELEVTEDSLSLTESQLDDLLHKQSTLQKRKKELQCKLDQLKALQSKGTIANVLSEDFDWSKRLRENLKTVFRVTQLRPLQLETMNTTMMGHDCMLIMPTGGGKSLCYQLPALLSTGITLVITPLVSLMEDQVMAMEQKHISAVMLTASSSKEVQNAVYSDITRTPCRLKLLYVTPEKIAKSKRFMSKLQLCHKSGLLSRIAIDEVHCCSQWGHDFRPDYKILGILKRQFPNTPLIGLTATASSNVLADVQKILQVEYATVFKSSFNRKNLLYSVQLKPSNHDDCMAEIASIISTKYARKSGLIYCFSKKDTDKVASDLKKLGVKCASYHADLSPEERSRVHRHWSENKIQVIVATVAFGMGIDKPDVKFVIHHSMSKSMENYYQESGRAGRDGEHADCILFFRFSDVFRQSCMVFTEATGLSKLYEMLEYCLSAGRCRRQIIAQHFSEVWDQLNCDGMCDHCSNTAADIGVVQQNVASDCKLVYEILDKAALLDSRLTAQKLLDALTGKGPVNARGTTSSKLNRDQCEYFLAFLLLRGYVKEDFHFTPYSTISYLLPGKCFEGNLLFMLDNNIKRPLEEMDEKCKTKRTKSNGRRQSSCEHEASNIVVIDDSD